MQPYKPANQRDLKARNNIRQLGSSAQSEGNQNQILSALDTLGARLIRSESERETMRKMLNDALDMQEKLENQLERSQMNIFQRLDIIENGEELLNAQELDNIQNQAQEILDTKEVLQTHRKDQLLMDDRLRDAHQTIQKLQRRLDSQEQSRTKLQRRIERVENIAADAQNALEAKAMVLLTDQSESVRMLEHHMQEQKMRLHTQRNEFQTMAHDEKSRWSAVKISVLPILVALGIGWGMAMMWPMIPIGSITDSMKFNSETPKSERLQPVVNDGVDNLDRDGAQNIQDINGDKSVTAPIDNIAVKVIEEPSIVKKESEYDVIQTVSDDLVTMDRDPSLPDDIKKLEAKAFENVHEAQHDLAALYTAGDAGVSQNYERAAFWFRQAANGNITNAAYNLGVLNQQGLGQDQDLQRALDWYRRAALSGHPEALYNLGIAYIEGVGTRYNPSMAATFFQQAAFGGIPEAAYNLGLILENGLLGEAKPQDALIWYRGAGDNGNNDAQQALSDLVNTMDIDASKAGLLDDGQSIARFMTPFAPGDTKDQLFENAIGDIGLGSLALTKDQVMVAQIQEQLRKMRLYNGPQDGVAGSGTVRAIQTYQRQHDLPIDGESNMKLLNFMLRLGTH